MTTTESRSNRRQRVITVITQFNLYEDEEELSIADQFFSTRLYLSLLGISPLLLIFFTSLSVQTRIVTVMSPSMTDFEHLTIKYPSTFACSCSQTAIPHKQFVAFDPRYHQVCSSRFISQEWISSLFTVLTSDYHPSDFRVIASAQFQVLALLCRTADQFVSDAIKQFNSSLLISKQVLFRKAFDVKTAALVNELKVNTLLDFYRTHRLLSTMISGSHIVSDPHPNFYMRSVLNSGEYSSFSSLYSNKESLSSTLIDTLDKCSCENTFGCTFPSGFYNFSTLNQLDDLFQSNPSPILFTPGMKTGCLPQDSLLQSTLECFFDPACLETIVAYTDALSTIPPLNFTTNLSRFSPKTTLDTILNEMMIESWQNTSNFADYFRSCVPSTCTYSYFQRLSIVYMVTTLVGLIGGLNVAFRMIAPLTVTFGIRQFQSKFCSQNENNNDVIIPNDSVVELSIQERMIHFLIQAREKIMAFNMFRKTLIDVQRGLYSTRTYVMLLLVGALILTVYSFITLHVQSVVIQNPTLEQYRQLQAQYPTVSCPCQQLSITISSFMFVQPVFHRVCSSIFVDNNGWLKYWPLIPINQSNSHIHVFDFRRTGATFFILLQAFCNVTLELVVNAVNSLDSMQFVTAQVITEDDFNAQLESLFLIFFAQFNDPPLLFRELVYANIRYTQFVTDLSTNAIPISTLANNTPLFLFTSVDYQNPMCSCDSSDPCTRSQGFYCQSPNCHQMNSVPNQTIPGLILGCYTYDSFLSSTLECLYDQTCIQMLIDWRLFDYTSTYLPINLSDITALNWNEWSYFKPQTTLGDIITELFAEDWIISSNYTDFYIQCQPSICVYTITQRNQLIYIITSVIGLLGGLTVILRIFVPPTVRILRVAHHYRRRTRHENQPNPHPHYSLFALARQSLIKLNVYETESNIENQLPATRIYLVLLILSITIISLFIGLTQQVHTITVHAPSESRFNDLYSRYPNTLSCPCTDVAIMCSIFSELSPINHLLCSNSSLSSDAWTFPFYTNTMWVDLDIFLLVTQFRLLSSICKHVKDEIDSLQWNYYGRKFMSFETVSRQSFELQINLMITSSIEEIVTKFRRSFVFISDTFRSNQLQNLYMTNWQTKFSTATENYILRSIPVSYNNGTCTCAVGMSNCSRPLPFNDLHNNLITLPGIVGGCLSIDGLRQSTLECFFDEICVNQLNILLNSSIAILSGDSTRFPPSTTQIGSLIDELLVESWITSSNYSNYFTECAPAVCRYSYIERNDIIYILTTLLGLYGGLTVALRLLVWHGLRLFTPLRLLCCRQFRRIDPASTSTAPQS